MSFRKNIDEYMYNIKVEDELKQKIYDSTVNKNGKSHRTAFAKKRIAIAVVACTLCIGTIAVTASEITGIWNKAVAKIFQVDEEMQKSISDKGYVNISSEGKEIATDTQNGITVSVKQVIADKYAVYIYLNVTSEDRDMSGEGITFRETEVTVEGDYMYSTIGRSIINTDEQTDKGSGFWICCSKEEENNVSDKEIKLKLTNLYVINGPMGGSVEGEWNLKWNLGSSQTMKTIKLNNTWTGKCKVGQETKTASVKFKSLEISPISYCLKYYCDLDEWCEFDWLNNEIPMRIVLKDGTAYSKPLQEGDTYLWASGNASEERDLKRFEILMDVDNIDYIEIGGKKYDME